MINLCFTVEDYPKDKEYAGSFVRELVVQLADMGCDISVIVPQSFTKILRHGLKIRPHFWQDITTAGNKIDIYQPLYLSYSNKLGKLNDRNFTRALRRGIKQVKKPYDAVYAHFWHNGVVAACAIKANHPIIVASGESQITATKRYSAEQIKRLQSKLRGVIYVSTKCLNESRSLGLQDDKTPFIIAPNGFNAEEFHQLDKKAARENLGFPQDAIIGIFTGAFIERKGVLRVCEAVKDIDNLKMRYAGSGLQTPTGDNILFSGKIQHSKLPEYLSASDFFILPTQNEGCCNAIVEALACGLPIISTDSSFNYDILNKENSKMVDAENIEEIRNAVRLIIADGELRKRMSNAALKSANNLNLTKRALIIKEFIYNL